ncbi:hypothetical protein [Taibaiella chishuiensis]|uniref:Uncharacterized protein n=1 Tax=Taibaiella chishuiensis TaxID=1434707 RepID=A0A2P8CV39_9BACT|nr:hypothetical protein [Taibaiella chishuiensis]PSK88826.1 hypothetical protein B0I18_11438 [Taibaiella chishuiensis]
MKQKIASAAQQFSIRHFTDINLDQKEFASKISTQLVQFADIEDKIDFISEIIRLGRELLNSSVKNLDRIERTGLDQRSSLLQLPLNYN